MPLESEAVRLVLIAAIFLLWGLIRLLKWWNARRSNAALLNQIAQGRRQGGVAATTPQGAEEVAELRRRFDAARRRR